MAAFILDLRGRCLESSRQACRDSRRAPRRQSDIASGAESARHADVYAASSGRERAGRHLCLGESENSSRELGGGFEEAGRRSEWN